MFYRHSICMPKGHDLGVNNYNIHIPLLRDAEY